MKLDRSPLKKKPRRLPGQSIDEHLHDRALDGVLFPILIAVVLLYMAAWEWYRSFVPTEPNPIVMTILALGGVAFAAFKLWRNLPKLRALKLARDGERGMAEVLDSLRDSGYKVFHDVLGEGFNIDHVVIGPTGVYTVETKTYTKPRRGRAVIHYDGQHVSVGRFKPDRDPIVQAQVQARWVSRLLRQVSGRKVKVQPAVVYPGWWIESTPGAHADVWVLATRGLERFLSRQPDRYSAEEVKQLANLLSRSIRPIERSA